MVCRKWVRNFLQCNQAENLCFTGIHLQNKIFKINPKENLKKEISKNEKLFNKIEHFEWDDLFLKCYIFKFLNIWKGRKPFVKACIIAQQTHCVDLMLYLS